MAQWGITGLKYFSHLTFGSGYFDFPGVCVMVPQTCYSAVEDLYNHIYIFIIFLPEKILREIDHYSYVCIQTVRDVLPIAQSQKCQMTLKVNHFTRWAKCQYFAGAMMSQISMF
jgi:hypothetical protein